VQCLSYSRFFEIGRDCADRLGQGWWAEEKTDGTLIQLWFDAVTDSWITSTTGSIDGSGKLQKQLTFSKLFWQTLSRASYELDKYLCYSFELQAPECQIVLKHKEPILTLHSVRSRATMQLLDRQNLLSVARALSVEAVKIFAGFDLEQISKYRELLGIEGFVLKSSDGASVKIKTLEYVSLHTKIDQLGDTAVQYLALTGQDEELDELVSVWPHLRGLIADSRESRDKILDSLRRYKREISLTNSSPQEYIKAVTSHTMQSLLFLKADTAEEALALYLKPQANCGVPKAKIKKLMHL
jgi:hypothetical protein